MEDYDSTSLNTYSAFKIKLQMDFGANHLTIYSVENNFDAYFTTFKIKRINN